MSRKVIRQENLLTPIKASERSCKKIPGHYRNEI